MNLTESFLIETKSKEQEDTSQIIGKGEGRIWIDEDQEDEVVSCKISQDSFSFIVILKTSDELYKIKVFDSDFFIIKFQKELGGYEDSYIKASKIIENPSGNRFCVPYLEDGNFKCLGFDRHQ